MNAKETKRQQEAFLNYLKISYSIDKIKTVEQYKSTYKWISLFDAKYKIADLTQFLITELNNVEL